VNEFKLSEFGQGKEHEEARNWYLYLCCCIL